MCQKYFSNSHDTNGDKFFVFPENRHVLPNSKYIKFS